MLRHEFVTQPASAVEYVSLLETGRATCAFSHLDVAVAYATIPGVKRLLPVVGDLKARWLVGIDWCRSDPTALDRLAAVAGSSVRVPNGAVVIERQDCT